MADQRAQFVERWTRVTRDAERADRAEQQRGELPRRRMLEGDYVQRWLDAHALAWADVARAGVDDKIQGRWRSAADFDTISPASRAALVEALRIKGYGDAEQQTAIQELDDWTITPQERALVLLARFWMAGQARPIAAPVVNDVAIFASDGYLAFVSAESIEEERQREVCELQERAERVAPDADDWFVIWGGDERMQANSRVMQWERVLGPLLQWSASGFFARHWRELSDYELRSYMESGPLTGQRIIAVQNDPLTRAREALSRRGPLVAPPSVVSADPVQAMFDDLWPEADVGTVARS